jgi:three-Cys-motif partner protein
MLDVTDAQEFFRKKRRWSRYKDLILDYYLEPYLAKVATLGRPILIADCFAGPGRFDDGEAGSPLLISGRLAQAQGRGAKVLGFYVEKDPVLHERLVRNTKEAEVPVRIRCGDFRECIGEISSLARDHTVFIYLDPIRPSDLLFTDMESVYDQLKYGHSVEVLINFMSTGFLRAVRGLGDQVVRKRTVWAADESVCRWDTVAGGSYWQDIVFDRQASNLERIERLAKGYAQRLRERFDWVISYPIREKYEHRFPKYHLVFGSRHPDAIELMNRAMVRARREFVGARFVDGFLFPNQPEQEVIRPEEIERMVLETCQILGKTTWRDLRARTTEANPCMYTDSEINQAIKRAVQTNRLGSNCPGKKIEENALIWPGAMPKSEE